MALTRNSSTKTRYGTIAIPRNLHPNRIFSDVLNRRLLPKAIKQTSRMLMTKYATANSSRGNPKDHTVSTIQHRVTVNDYPGALLQRAKWQRLLQGVVDDHDHGRSP
jgi:hypothetical protein